MEFLIRNNEIIYSLLEKSNMLFSDFNSDKIVSFDKNDDFFVVLYLSSTRNFMAFKAEGYAQNKSALSGLLQFVQEADENILPLVQLEKVINIIEDKFHSKNNSDFFFDAH